MDYATSADLTIMPLLRVLRVLRIIKLVPKAKGLKMMMTTLLWSMPALLNVATVLFMFMFIYVSHIPGGQGSSLISDARADRQGGRMVHFMFMEVFVCHIPALMIIYMSHIPRGHP